MYLLSAVKNISLYKSNLDLLHIAVLQRSGTYCCWLYWWMDGSETRLNGLSLKKVVTTDQSKMSFEDVIKLDQIIFRLIKIKLNSLSKMMNHKKSAMS